MIVIEVWDVIEDGNIWGAHYTRKTEEGKGYKGIFLCETLEEAQQKHAELMDVLKNNGGLYIGKKAKQKLRAARNRATQP